MQKSLQKMIGSCVMKSITLYKVHYRNGHSPDFISQLMYPGEPCQRRLSLLVDFFEHIIISISPEHPFLCLIGLYFSFSLCALFINKFAIHMCALFINKFAIDMCVLFINKFAIHLCLAICIYLTRTPSQADHVWVLDLFIT